MGQREASEWGMNEKLTKKSPGKEESTKSMAAKISDALSELDLQYSNILLTIFDSFESSSLSNKLFSKSAILLGFLNFSIILRFTYYSQ